MMEKPDDTNEENEVTTAEYEYVQRATETLASLSGKGVKWWRYSISHQIFELVVGDSTGNENMVLVLGGCKHIAGPVEWSNQRLGVAWEIDAAAHRWKYTLTDDSVEFRAEGFFFLWRSNFDILRHMSLYQPADWWTRDQGDQQP